MLLSKKSSTFIGLAAFAILLLAGAAFGQASSTAGAIGGTVLDQAGAAISGATVTVHHLDTGLQRTMRTADDGHFSFPLLPVGSYEVTVNASGFSEFKQTGITLQVGESPDLRVELKPAGTNEEVHITAEAPIADPSKTEVATSIGEQAIHELPINGRRWSQFVLLTPGVTMDGSFGLISFRGISGLLNNNSIDGTDNNQAFFSEERGRTRLNYVVSQESIKEFQVNVSNYSAEFGRSAGGVTNAVTKSGTNEIHGSGFYYVRDTVFNARNPLNFITTGIDSTGAPILAAINPDDRRQQFGGTIGGPIKKDKLFWFFSYDEQLRNFPINAQPSSPLFFSDCVAPNPGSGLKPGPASACNAALNALVPQTGVSPRNGNQWIFFPKIDWQINANNQFTASYNYLKWSSLNGIQTQPVVAFANSGNGSDDVRVDSLNFRLVSMLGSNKLNEARVQYARDFEFEPTNDPTDVGAAIEGFQIGPPSFLPRPKFPDEKKVELVDDFSIVKGSHSIKFGADILRSQDDIDNLRNEFGTYTYGTKNGFSGVTNFGIDLVTPGSKNYLNYQQAFGPSKISFYTYDLSGFIQDQWKVTRTVTLNYGLRYEYIKMPGVQFPNALFSETLQLPEDNSDFGP
ncbi:MAG TPA: carboxypeptidase regulatory-like domain-containing protein, partial [Blastocatellia bacterium]|nr:carboxypeptidase regulatory-like domain-containing protein [Blastocatellia bacterium]